MNKFFDKLPFKALAEKIPAGARAKVPLLEKAIPFANQIASGLIATLLVVTIANIAGSKSNPLANTGWVYSNEWGPYGYAFGESDYSRLSPNILRDIVTSYGTYTIKGKRVTLTSSEGTVVEFTLNGVTLVADNDEAFFGHVSSSPPVFTKVK